ncbi:hypothetical protein [Paraglaciecola sp. 2405UD69-4]|uniref:hypothetical protein n=1 Tax=Paraglaciecola sp. 2405UD69-4 TaxID=3391836 RepID=UPI0039C95E6A
MLIRYLPKLDNIFKVYFFTLIFTSIQLESKELEIKGELTTTGYVYQTETDTQKSEVNQVAAITPSATAIYSSKHINMSATAEHVKVERFSGDVGVNESYTEFSYNGSSAFIDNALTLSIRGQESYRVINQEQDYVSDKVLASGDLTKFNNTVATLNFITPNPEYIGLSTQTRYSETTSEQSLESELGLDSSNRSVTATIFQGTKVENINWNLSTIYNDISRSSFQDYSSTLMNGFIGIPVSQNMSVIFQGSSSTYDVDTDSLVARTNLDTTSYGAGLEWQPMEDRSVSITYNQLKEGDNNISYLGLGLDWAFSSRTALNFNYDKKFYGDAYSIDFSHNLKFFRSSLAYSEQVTSFSLLSTDEGTTALFVCPFGSVDLSECFQPDSLNYELQAGEEFISSTDIETDISEEIILRKAGSFKIGYDKRRLKTALTLSFGETEYLESGQFQTTRRARLIIAYELSQKTDVTLNTLYSISDLRSSDNTNTTVTSSIDITRKVSQHLESNFGMRLLDRNSSSANNDVNDKRITLGLTYIF